MLRWLVSNYIRQTAKQKIFATASQYSSTAGAGQNDPAEELPPQRKGPALPCHVAFSFAIGLESGGLVDLLEQSTSTKCHTFVEHLGKLKDKIALAIETGEGSEKTTQALLDFLTMYEPFWIISCGFAEATQPDLKRGDIVMADRVLDESGKEFATGLHIDPKTVAETPNLHLGPIVSVKSAFRTPDERTQLGNQHGTLACDMESFSVAQVCAEREIRFLAVKIITDARDDNPPPEVSGYLHQQTFAGKMGAAAGTLFRKPSAIKTMFQLRQNALKASDRLARFLVSMIDQL